MTTAEPSRCDICEASFVAPGSMMFNTTTRSGPWGYFCKSCYDENTFGRLGTGLGQRYVRQPDGKWLKTGG